MRRLLALLLCLMLLPCTALAADDHRDCPVLAGALGDAGRGGLCVFPILTEVDFSCVGCLRCCSA